MARFMKGDVVVVPFPFSDLTDAKRRPALVIAELSGDDLILCQITSQNVKDHYLFHYVFKMALIQGQLVSCRVASLSAAISAKPDSACAVAASREPKTRLAK